MKKVYDFETQNLIGQQGESKLDGWLRLEYGITDVSGVPYFQERCIDRILERRDRSTIFAEYKFDKAAKRTGNVFFETISVDSRQIPGWGWKTQADYLFILIPDQEIIILKPEMLRALMWEERHSLIEKHIPNINYNTKGCPITINKVRDISFYWSNICDNLFSLELPVL